MDQQLLAGFCTGQENLDLIKAVSGEDFRSVLDIGGHKLGAGIAFALLGKHVTSITIGDYWPKRMQPVCRMLEIDYRDCEFEKMEPQAGFNAIWASHVIEHSRNVGAFLDRCFDLLKDGGWLFVVVPPFKHQVVQGHVAPGWNIGLLVYNLLAGGFNVKDGHFLSHGYNIIAAVQKTSQTPVRYHEELFAPPYLDLWPVAFDPKAGFDGNLREMNWPQGYRDRMEQDLSVLRNVGSGATGEVLDALPELWG